MLNWLHSVRKGKGRKDVIGLSDLFSPFASDPGQENVANPAEDREIIQRDLQRSKKYEQETIK